MIGFTKSIASVAIAGALVLTAALGPAQATTLGLHTYRPSVVGCDLTNWEPQIVARLKPAVIPCGGKLHPVPLIRFRGAEALGTESKQAATTYVPLRIASCGWSCRIERRLSGPRRGPPAVAAVRG